MRLWFSVVLSGSLSGNFETYLHAFVAVTGVAMFSLDRVLARPAAIPLAPRARSERSTDREVRATNRRGEEFTLPKEKERASTKEASRLLETRGFVVIQMLEAPTVMGGTLTPLEMIAQVSGESEIFLFCS